jgi:hypothetical protein
MQLTKQDIGKCIYLADQYLSREDNDETNQKQIERLVSRLQVLYTEAEE